MNCIIGNLSNDKKIDELTIGERLHWLAFRGLEGVLAVRDATRNKPTTSEKELPIGPQQRWLWVYAYAIGELGVAEPLLRRLLAQRPDLGLLFIIGRGAYREAYKARFPKSSTWKVDGCSGATIGQMGVRCPPVALLIIEMPCLLWEAPCRFPFAVIKTAKTAGAFIAVVNGWLYGAQPACRMDRLEQRWFGRAYVRLIDRFLVQTEEVGRAIVAAGAAPAHVCVTGNITAAISRNNTPELY